MKSEKLIEVIVKLKDSPLYNKKAIFTIDDPNIKDNTLCNEDTVELYTEDTSFEINIVTFSGHKLNKIDAAFQTLNAYLRDDESYEYLYVHPLIKELKEKQKKITVKDKEIYSILYQIEPYEIEQYKLIAVTREEENTHHFFKYYTTEEDPICMLLHNDNHILTDIEEFFIEGLLDDVEHKRLVYQDESYDITA